MISSAFVWFYIAAISAIYGLILNHFLSSLLTAKIQLPVPLTIINGLILLNWLLAILQLFVRIDGIAHLLILFGAIVYLFLCRAHLMDWIKEFAFQVRQIRLVPAILFSLLALYILILIVSPITHSDTGLYHAPTVLWFEKYAIVPGLGNLQGRLAFNNLWFVLSAFFSLSFLGLQPFYVLNGFIALAFSTYCLWLTFLRSGRGFRIPAMIAGFLAALPMFTLQFAFPSLSPDLPSILLTWLVLLLFLQKQDDPSPFAFDIYTVLLVLYSVYALTLKISSAPIFLAPAILLVGPLTRRQWRPILGSVLLAVIVSLPWFVRSYFLSGYLVYPFQAIDLFHPDWKIPFDLVKLESDLIQNWSVVRYQIDYQTILHLPLNEWFSFWYNHPSPWVYEDLISTCFPIAVLFMIGSSLAALIRRRNWILPLTYLVVIVGCVFWFFTAPAPRFGLGFLMFLLFLPLAQVIQPLLSRTSRITGRVLTGTIMGAVLVYFAFTNFAYVNPFDFQALHKRNLVFQSGYPAPSIGWSLVDGQKIYYPTGGGDGLCWYEVLPCAPSPDLHIELRGQSLGDGFRYHP